VVQVPTYPSLRQSFDQDFYQSLDTALKKDFQGEYKRAIENKKAAFVVVDLTDLQQPRVAGANPDVMMYAARDVSNQYSTAATNSILGRTTFAGI
jgi:hypothetical protein